MGYWPGGGTGPARVGGGGGGWGLNLTLVPDVFYALTVSNVGKGVACLGMTSGGTALGSVGVGGSVAVSLWVDLLGPPSLGWSWRIA